jgi:hypothetical protein
MAGKHDQMYSTMGSNIITAIDSGVFSRTTKSSQNRVYAPAEEAAVYDNLYEQFTKAPDEDSAKKLVLQMEAYLFQQHWTVLASTSRVGFYAHLPRLRGFSSEGLFSFPEPWFWIRFWVTD